MDNEQQKPTEAGTSAPQQPEQAGATQPQPAGNQPNTGMAIVAYILFFVPLLTDAKKDSFVKFHVKQGMVVFALAVILWIIRMFIPWYWLWKLYWLFNLISLAILVFAIIGIVNAANGKQEKLPLIGKFGDLFKI